MNSQAQSQRKVQKTVNRRTEQLEKDKEAKKKEAKRLDEEKRKAHFEMQTKAVQKRMKKTKKKSKRNNDNKKEFFVKRWFKR